MNWEKYNVFFIYAKAAETKTAGKNLFLTVSFHSFVCYSGIIVYQMGWKVIQTKEEKHGLL